MKWRSIFFGVGERGAFVQILGGHRIGGDSLHDGKGEVQQGAGVEDVGLCWSDAGAVVVGADEEAVDDFGEEAIGPVGLCAFTRGVDFFHGAPDAAAMLDDRDFVMGDAFVGEVGDVLDVVE